MRAPDLRERLRHVVPFKNRLMKVVANGHVGALKELNADAIADEYLGHAEKIRPFVADTSLLIDQLPA